MQGPALTSFTWRAALNSSRPISSSCPAMLWNRSVTQRSHAASSAVPMVPGACRASRGWGELRALGPLGVPSHPVEPQSTGMAPSTAKHRNLPTRTLASPH